MTTSTAVSTQTDKPALPAVTGPAAQFPSLADTKFNEQGQLVISDFRSIMEFAQLAVAANMFKDVTSVAKGIMKISYGQKIGLDPLESLNDIYESQGRLGVWGASINRKILEHPRYSYKLLQNSDEVCEMQCYIDGEATPSTIKFTIAKAKTMGLLKTAPWQNDSQLMLFYKVVARAYKIHFGDVFKVTVSTVEDITDEANSAQFQQDKPALINQTAQEVANERAQQKILEDAFTDVEPIPYDETAKVTASDKAEAIARVAEETGDTAKAEKVRKQDKEFEDAANRVTAAAVTYSKILVEAQKKSGLDGVKAIKSWIETKFGIAPQDQIKNLTPEQRLAAMKEIDPNFAV